MTLFVWTSGWWYCGTQQTDTLLYDRVIGAAQCDKGWKSVLGRQEPKGPGRCTMPIAGTASASRGPTLEMLSKPLRSHLAGRPAPRPAAGTRWTRQSYDRPTLACPGRCRGPWSGPGGQGARIEPALAERLLDLDAAVPHDSRSRDACPAGHAAGAVSLPEAEIGGRYGELPTDKALIIC